MVESVKVFFWFKVWGFFFFFKDQKEIEKNDSVRSNSLLRQCHLLLAMMWFPLDINVLILNQDAEQPVKGELQKAMKKRNLR